MAKKRIDEKRLEAVWQVIEDNPGITSTGICNLTPETKNKFFATILTAMEDKGYLLWEGKPDLSWWTGNGGKPKSGYYTFRKIHHA
jgi:hypothetical protein